MALLDSYIRVSRRHPCPVCAKPDWCLVSRDGSASPCTAVCTRVESSKRIGEAGWLHRLRKGRWNGPRLHTVHWSAETQDLGLLSRRLQDRLDDSSLHHLAQELGLPTSALRRLGVGLAVDEDLGRVGLRYGSHAWTFPMVDSHGHVKGIRLRLPGGRKLAVKGGKNGIFVPADLPDTLDRLFIGEGESDTAALLALRLDAIGRPGCRSGMDTVSRYVRARHPREIVVVADADDVGRTGADELARQMRLVCRLVRVILPPPEFKDVREWVRAGARAADVLAIVEQTPVIGIELVTGVRP